MRAKLWLSVGVAVMMALGIAGGTLALFSDATASQDSTYTAGTLSLNSWRDQGDTVPGPMFYTTPSEGATTGGLDGLLPTGYWAPGDTHMRVLLVRNTGSLDAWLVGVGADMAPGSSQYLAEKLTYKITTDGAGTNIVASGVLHDLITTDQLFPSKIAHNATTLPVHMRPPKPFYFFVTLPLDADNSYQNLTLRVDFTVHAEQKANNP